MSFVHIHFKGETTSPWHIGKRQYGDYLYTRDDYLWGRGIRGPVLRQLWRTFCPKSDAIDGVEFYPDSDCPACSMSEGCPFWNLRGTADEGEFKDKPRLIITNLYFDRDTIKKDRVALATLSEQYLGVVEAKAPVFIEYLEEGARFDFEAILMSRGVDFAEEFISAVKVSLKFLGWGGFCNEGFGRGEINNVLRHGFNSFEHKYVEPLAERILEEAAVKEMLTFNVSPMLILYKNQNGRVYKSICEEGFSKKLCNCINERNWQFYDRHVHIQDNVKEVSGKAKKIGIHAWSRKTRGKILFEGIGEELTIHFNGKLEVEEARALALAKYGVGGYKNQGFGSLRLVGGERPM
ncbi:MAG: hypothetical protein ACUVUS_10180 [Thermoproteota archaeon]